MEEQENPNSAIESVVAQLKEASETMRYRVSSKFLEDFEALEKVINSINSKLCITSQK
jgi:hypothetical protein